MNPNMEIPTPKKNPFSAQMDLSKFEKASEEEKKQQDVMAQSSTFFRDGMKKLLRNPLALRSGISSHSDFCHRADDHYPQNGALFLFTDHYRGRSERQGGSQSETL